MPEDGYVIGISICFDKLFFISLAYFFGIYNEKC